MPRQFSTVIEKNRPIPLRDGTLTYADVYRPLDGPPVPAVLIRDPYDKERYRAPLGVDSEHKLAERGFAVVHQDVRGRFSSEGLFYPYENETQDGYDSVAWVTKQPWCNGSVALWGVSYYGLTATLGARLNPLGLKAIVAYITSDDIYETWSYHGGALQLGFLATWGGNLALAQTLRSDSQVPDASKRALAEALQDPDRLLFHRPLSTLPGLSAPGAAPWWADWVGHPSNDTFWRKWRFAESHTNLAVPTLHVGGWFDIFLAGTLRNFLGMTKAGLAPQKLTIGPWAHTSNERFLGALDFGPSAPGPFSPLTQDAHAWLGRHLAHEPEVDSSPIVRYFLMGANQWRETAEWPPPDTQAQRWYLHSNGAANGAAGNGLLTLQPPSGMEPDDTFRFDPQDPVPTRGGNILIPTMQAGPHDQREIEARRDVLVYTSAPLERDLIVVGPVTVHLSATTDALDTDWTAKLVEVHPNGMALNLCDGILRARYRDGTHEPHLLAPGRPYDYSIDLVATANVFKAGHRIRLDISSSNFPRFDRNSNTGGSIFQEATGRIASQRVHHSAAQPSWLELPINANAERPKTTARCTG